MKDELEDVDEGETATRTTNKPPYCCEMGFSSASPLNLSAHLSCGASRGKCAAVVWMAKKAQATKVVSMTPRATG